MKNQTNLNKELGMLGNYTIEHEPETRTVVAHKGTAVSIRIPVKDENVAEALAEITELLGF